ncbi:bifunctional [glutamate--ammonia ligase]-adenylyl-L-tyrosine phosphorylase/[glutamate--ammonia-ligase] adenylyltransferase [Lysobacter sp. A3-1-A15]|uniref:bifunctional [glutamate--ammonia ligase]-adenylyl-L-tyrosine phosphorylase/[glutamate--ammonia-ligase] adenylyltransferase n=1 Tax=Novilysobacter viscosus TaxID=3098602 RepID=UPI002ED7E0EC
MQEALDKLVARALQRLQAAGAWPGGTHTADAATHLSSRGDDNVRVSLERLATASDFAIDTLVRQPELLAVLLDDSATPVAEPVLEAGERERWMTQLRRFRAAESTRLVWRDVLGLDTVEATLAGSTRLAESCLRLALSAVEGESMARHGMVRDAAGSEQRLVVFGLGKLGGQALNFSSDIDLVYGFEEGGASDGARPLDAETYFTRQAQQLGRLLDEMTADGFCHRVDLRLRPYGNAGRVAWSFAAMEQYFQHEGRDWERYAWQKARPVAGDIDAGERFLEALRPFVYRRYLDFGALDGLRTMKASIAAEVARKELADDIKRGPGGIREIEFLIQALQLIRGGREPELRGRGSMQALDALVEAHQVDPAAGEALTLAYRFLRRLENRLQMLRDAQVHAVPVEPLDRLRIARGLGHPGWASLAAELETQRAVVSEEFDALLAPRRRHAAPDALAGYWHALPEAGEPRVLADAGFADASAADAVLRDFARSPGVASLSDATRPRLDRVMPALLHGAASSGEPMLALRRLLAMLHNILRRSAYLALLDEEPAALARLVDVVEHSALLAERLAAYPLLLDELLDARVSGPLPDRAGLLEVCDGVDPENALGTDTEATLQGLNELRQALGFRIAMALRDGRQEAADSARQLAWLADGVVRRVLALAEREVAMRHGRVPQARFAVIGYGSLGGEELGFGSDLDLVFLYDAAADAESDGPRPLEAPRWFVRLAQKIVALLGAPTGAGHLYEVDVRLRPDGAGGLLVSSLSSYADYQAHRAWTWEHQALVRARCVGGDPGLCAAFEQVRHRTLAAPRDHAGLRADVVQMRARMRAELDRSGADGFDLKQGEGGLVDLEFLLQALVLGNASRDPGLLQPRATPLLVDAAQHAGLLQPGESRRLSEAHATLLARALECTLDRRSRRVAIDDGIQTARTSIREVAQNHGLDFSAAPVGGQ